MGFFKKIGKAVSNVAKTVTKTVGNVVKTVAPIASVIPGVGTLVSGAASVLGEVLSPTKQVNIVEAVEEQGVVKVDKIENTIVNENPNIDVATLQASTEAMTQLALQANPTAKVDDSNSSVTKIDTFTKIWQWVKSNFLLVGGGFIAAWILLFNKNGGRRRRW